MGMRGGRGGRRLLIGAAVVLVLGVAAAALLLSRSSASVASQVDPDVTLVCQAGTGLDSEACRAWGDGQLDAGPPTTTFEMDDLARLELHRSMLGFGPDCEAVYFIERYADSPAWNEDVDCPGG